MKLTDSELNRYSRHIRLKEVGLEGQLKLKQAKVLVVGAGGLGCPVLQYLTAAGVGCIGILDYDVVDESNLQRQVLYNVDDIDKPKPLAAKQHLTRQNPEVEFKIYFLKLTKDVILNIFKEYDIIVDCTDNFPVRYLINDACVLLDKPLVYGAIHKFEGHVTVFNYRNGSTLRCFNPEPPDPLEAPSCAEVGVIGTVAGIIGSFQANEVVKIIIGIGEILSGKLFVFNALDYQTNIFSIDRNDETANVQELSDYTDFCLSDTLNINQISPKVLKLKMEKGEKIQLIDVRELNVENSNFLNAISIPLDEIPDNIHLISREIPVIFFCQYEIKSISAINYLQNKFGFTNLFSLKDGLMRWNVHTYS